MLAKKSCAKHNCTEKGASAKAVRKMLMKLTTGIQYFLSQYDC